MAVRNLKIIVVDGSKANGGSKTDGVDKKSDSDKKNTGKNSALYKALNFNETIKDKFKSNVSPTTFFAVQQGIGLASQTARQFINYYISDIGRQNGDGNYQAIVNRRIEQITDGASILGGALAGAAVGSATGGIGAIGGAAAGAISAGINIAFRQADRVRTYQHEMFKENNSQSYALARAGNSALTGRLR